MAELKTDFKRKTWKDCCGKGCKKCEIAQAYTDEFGRKEGLEKLNADRKLVLAGKKSGKKSGGKGGGKKKGAGKGKS